jgi:hypothetical protein
MKIITSETLNGVAVTQIKKFLGYTIYQESAESSDETVELLFVDASGTLQGRITISADCGQNVGYVSDIVFKEEGK